MRIHRRYPGNGSKNKRKNKQSAGVSESGIYTDEINGTVHFHPEVFLIHS